MPGITGIHLLALPAVVEKCGSSTMISQPAFFASRNVFDCIMELSSRFVPEITSVLVFTQSRVSFVPPPNTSPPIAGAEPLPVPRSMPGSTPVAQPRSAGRKPKRGSLEADMYTDCLPYLSQAFLSSSPTVLMASSQLITSNEPSPRAPTRRMGDCRRSSL